MYFKRWLWRVLGLVWLLLASLGWLQWTRAHPVAFPPSYRFDAGQANLWRPYGGNWMTTDGAVHNDSEERGAKLLTGSKDWTDYTLNADVRLDGDRGDAGVVVRSDYEKQGVDAYSGYYIGLRTSGGDLVIGRSNYAWVEARPVPLPGGVHPAVWYRLRVTAYRCNIAASAQNLSTLQTVWVAFEERSCAKAGRIGLRSVETGATWRNVSVAPAGWNDYLLLRQHAGPVERPLVLDGPPWWTPWHVGMLFAGALAFALLSQFVYFRMQQWKAYAVTEERERLAHEIHDTMAQSFAGVGYQIQGIRSMILRGEGLDAPAIADKLGVAYQLVRRCHEEASRTIAMLGSSSSPPGQQDLLRGLAKTARKIAGNQIRTVTRLQGEAIPLSLRLTNALLQIGQEAIANAVGHADPTVLIITMVYQRRCVELIVEDDGRGFECTPEKSGFGILGMQKRARDIGGALEIVSMPGKGTQVRIRASLKPQKRILESLRRRVPGHSGWFSQAVMGLLFRRTSG